VHFEVQMELQNKRSHGVKTHNTSDENKHQDRSYKAKLLGQDYASG
jgi:hypothetical protein